MSNNESAPAAAPVAAPAVEQDPHSAAIEAGSRELDVFVNSLRLSTPDAALARNVAMHVASAAGQLTLMLMRNTSVDELDQENFHRVRTLALGIALKTGEIEARLRSSICPCARCARERYVAMPGWRRALLRLRGRFRRSQT